MNLKVFTLFFTFCCVAIPLLLFMAFDIYFSVRNKRREKAGEKRKAEAAPRINDTIY